MGLGCARAVTRGHADYSDRLLRQRHHEAAASIGNRFAARVAAVAAGAERFLTNNRRDFPQTITELAITYPDGLPEPD